MSNWSQSQWSQQPTGWSQQPLGATSNLVVPLLLGGVVWSAIRVHRYAAAHPVQLSWKRPIVAVMAWFLLLCIFIASVSFVAATLHNSVGGLR